MHRRVWAGLGLGGVLLAAAPAFTQRGEPAVKQGRFFTVDVAQQKVLTPQPHVAQGLTLKLSSVTTDQPQYWPRETVFLKVLMPGRPGASVTATVQARNTAGNAIKGTLDAQGVWVAEVLNGSSQPLALGEYRVDVQSADGALGGSTTFSVVEGALGAVSLAHPFEKVTAADMLDTLKAGWFLGNAGGAGKRWGNGLSFKNELRVANQPFTGEVEVHSRCMLPGCNGTDAGPAQKLHVHKGVVEGTMNVGGHSGPFQIEVITPSGTLRHQFEGSSHVERDMVQVSGGVGFVHRAGMAPYQGTTQVPGRQVFLESAPSNTADAWELPRVLAQDGVVQLTARKNIQNARVVVFSPRPNGTFSPQDVPVGAVVSTGQTLNIPVTGPYSVLVLGGFVERRYTEAWATLFTPGQLNVEVRAPATGAPQSTIQVVVEVKNGQGPAALSGVLEVFDTRVASRNPAHGLGSELGESFRRTSSLVSSWEDRTGMERDASKKEAMEEEAPRRSGPPGRPGAAPSRASKSMALNMGPPPAPSVARSLAQAPGRQGQPEQNEEPPQELIREDERKVVFCGRVETDSQGRATVNVVLPPQTGRLSARFVAVAGMDWGEGETGLDVGRAASVDVAMPHVFVPGARLTVMARVNNSTGKALTLKASGTGFSNVVVQVPSTGGEFPLAWNPTDGGEVTFDLRGADGKTVDARRTRVHSALKQPVTWSRLVVDTSKPVDVPAGMTLVQYPNAGALLRGISMNMLTTMESWFGHAEALGARAAATAVMLAAMERGLLPADNTADSIRVMHEKTTRDLEEVFFDPAAGLFRPYPGLPGNAVWTAWVAASLHQAQNAIRNAKVAHPLVQQSLARMERLCAAADVQLHKQGVSSESSGGVDAQGQEVIPVEVDGKVLFRVPTDDTVTRWAVKTLVPEVSRQSGQDPVVFSKLVDRFRFLKAFERVGLLQYLATVARGLWERGEKDAATKLTQTITRGMILAQEPGMLQGPALLGGVYAAPRAMVSFLELLLVMSAGSASSDAEPKTFQGPTTVRLPAGAVARMDHRTVLDVQRLPLSREILIQAPTALERGKTARLSITLPAGMDPLEYVALITVPTTVNIKQTEDILSDHSGVLLYGQQQSGGTQMNTLSVAFRGSRSVVLEVDGALPGTSAGWVVVRHVENPQDAWRVMLPEVKVP